jgi:hypothetical protein
MTTTQEENLKLLLTKMIPSKEVNEIIASHTPPSLCQTIFSQARMYNDAYLMLKSSMDKTGELNVISPMLMNLCFSIELLMKAYILFENKDIIKYSELLSNGISIRGHKYSDLFNKIKPEYKKDILLELSEKLNIPTIDESAFKQILIEQNCDNSFAEWRYIFEQDSNQAINFELLMNLNATMGVLLSNLIKR